MSKITVYTKINILLHGELTYMDDKQVQSWFEEALKCVERNQWYRMARRLTNAKTRYELQLKEKNNG